MKSELRHLLDKLKADHPDAQNLVLSMNGVSSVTLQHGCKRFESIDALERYAYPSPPSDGGEGRGEAPSLPSLPSVKSQI